MQQAITDDLDALMEALPPRIRQPLAELGSRGELLEVVLDLGRSPEARYVHGEVTLSDQEITHDDLEYVTERIGDFGADNRAGIPRTLHRISAIRNRKGRIVGLTCRIGRAVFGTIRIIEDLVQSRQSVLLLGPPGVGKTTMLREVARVLADDMDRRVIVVDTSNEIAGDGDIPHPAIGHARRMQVPTPSMQHAVMIEAVENHMPEVIIIDEIGTELEAAAARTIAERGVQLVGTAHGNSLDNLLMNPTLSDLVGGIQSVTLGDEEARRRGTQKSILERKAPPTFDMVVEIQTFNRVAVHTNVAEVVDATLRGYPATPEVRYLDEQGTVQHEAQRPARPAVLSLTRGTTPERLERTSRPAAAAADAQVVSVYPFGVNRNQLQQAARGLGLSLNLVSSLEEATAVLTLKSYYRKKPQILRDAEAAGLPTYVLKSNTQTQIQQALAYLTHTDIPRRTSSQYEVSDAMMEAEHAIEEVMESGRPVDLNPQNAYVRRLQHQLAERYELTSRSRGKEPNRWVQILRA